MRDRNKSLITEIEDLPEKHLSVIASYLLHCQLINQQPKFLDELAPFADDIERYIKEERIEKNLPFRVRGAYELVLRFTCPKLKSSAPAGGDVTENIPPQATDSGKTTKSIFSRLFKRR